MRLMLLSLGLDVSICSPCVSPARRCTSLRSHIGHTFRRNGFNGSWTKMLNILSSRSLVADRQASGHWAGAAPIRPSFDQTGTQAQLPWEACSWLFLSLCSRIMASENNRKIGAPPLWFDLPELKIACSALSQKVKDSRPRQIIQLTVSEKAEVWKVFLLPFF